MAEMTAAEAQIQEIKNMFLRDFKLSPCGQSQNHMTAAYEKRERWKAVVRLVEQQAAEIARLKLLCEKKTIENCKVIKQSFREGVGRPEMIDGKCEGYAISDWDDEPHDSCKECIAGMESEEAWLQEMEGRR